MRPDQEFSKTSRRGVHVDMRRLAISAYPNALYRFRSELTLAFESKAEQRYQKDLVMAILLSLLLLEVRPPEQDTTRLHGTIFVVFRKEK
jgi:hypothetical protein